MSVGTQILFVLWLSACLYCAYLHATNSNVERIIRCADIILILGIITLLTF